MATALLVPTIAQARPTYGPGTGGSIPDGSSSGYSSTINITDDLTVSAFNNIVINGLTHTYGGDLVATLTHNNITVDIFDRIGRTTSSATNYGTSGAFTGGAYTFVASGGTNIPTSGAIGAGTYNTYINGTAGQSSTATGTFASFAGTSLLGAWTLNISDRVGGDTGSFSSWSFNANTAAPPPPPLGTYNGSGGNITDATTDLTSGVTTPGVTTSDINVTDNFTIQSVNSVTISGLVHSLVGDLTIQLEHVGTGVVVDLTKRLGQVSGNDEFDYGDDSNFNGNYTFALNGTSLLTAAQQGNTGYDIPSGTYAESTSLDPAFANANTLSNFAGQNINGTWRLRITDSASGDTGSFLKWSLNTTPAASVVPEAGTMALFLPALGGIAALVVRRRRARVS